MKNILDYDATCLREKITKGELTITEVTETYIRHIKTVNPHINALVENRFTEALLEAKERDELLRQGQGNGRLFGVPISVKESFDVAGMRTTGGLVNRKNAVATADAEVVARLRQEGAIILGKTNTPALCFCQETENKLYGRTNNPWDLERTAGGSSGGEGALLAVGGAAVGMGSDIGGSIRFPAHFNGIVGFKSGNGLVSQEGHFPFSTEPLQKRMLGMGAMAKSVNDAELINNIIAIEAPPDINPDEFRLTVLPKQEAIPLGDETQQYMEQIAKELGKDYSLVQEVPPFFHQISLMWQLIMSFDEQGEMVKAAFGNRPIHPVWEYLKEVLTGTSELHRYLTWAFIGAGLFKPSKAKIAKVKADLARADEEVKAYFDHRVLVLPVYHRAALPHGELYRELFSLRKTFLRYLPYIALANVLGLPSLVVPVGIDGHGLPIGVQLVSAVGNEKALFHFGRFIEQEFRGYLRCTKYDAK